jgi:hypothetical protein
MQIISGAFWRFVQYPLILIVAAVFEIGPEFCSYPGIIFECAFGQE